MGRQQAGAGAVRAGIQLEAEHAQRVEADADGAGGVAGLEVEDEALCPFLALGLAGAVAEVAVEIDVLGLQGGAAVFDEAGGLGERGEAGEGRGGGDARGDEPGGDAGCYSHFGSEHRVVSILVVVAEARHAASRFPDSLRCLPAMLTG
ncbi:hypothetical protein D3C76_1035470 [compost metagenome]